MKRKHGHLGDRGAEDALNEVAEQKQRQLTADLREVMATPWGRRFVWWLIDDLTNTHGTTFTGNSQTFWQEGRRSVGVELRVKVLQEARPDAVHMLNEAVSALNEEELQRQAAENSAETDNGGSD